MSAIPTEVQEAANAAVTDLDDETIETPTGPMADNPATGPEHLDLDAVDVEIERRTVRFADRGVKEVHDIGLEINLGRDEYNSYLQPQNPQLGVSPAEAVYRVMERHGIARPDATADLGVQIGFPDNTYSTAESEQLIRRAMEASGDDREAELEKALQSVTPSRQEDRVIVHGYIPVNGETLAADGFGSVVVLETGMTLVQFLATGLGLLGGAILVDNGEEYTVKNNLDTVSLDFGVYNDATDAITDAEDLADLTTEPSTGNYARQTEAMSAAQLSGDWGIDNDTVVTFDMTNTTGTVQDWFAEVNTALAAGTADYLMVTGDMSQSYDLSNLTQLEISAGGVGWTID